MAMDDDSKGEPDSPGSDDSGMEQMQPLRGEAHPRLPSQQQQQPYRMDRSRVNPRMPSLAILPMRVRRGAASSFPAAPLPSGRPSASQSQRIGVPSNWSRAHDADELESARVAHGSASAASSSAVAPVPSLADQERFQVSLEIERRFRALLWSRLGFQIVPQAEDGNCMFRSVAHQVYGDAEQHALVRAAVMQYMSLEREFFREFIAGETFEAYIERMKCDGEWGDNVELQAMSEIYERPIEIYAYSDKPLKTFMSAAASSASAAAGAGAGAGSAASSAAASSSSSVPARAPPLPIRLSYHFASHYNSVIHPVQHPLSYRAQPPPGTMEQEALARVARMRLMMAEQQRAAQAAAAAAAASSSAAAASSSAASSSPSDLPGSLASSRSAFSSFQSGLASNPSGFDQAVAASLSELDAAFESEVSQAQQQSLEQREKEEARMLDAACQQSERDDLDHAIAEATRVATSAAAAAQPQQPRSASSSAAAAASSAASPTPSSGSKKPSVEEEVYQRALAASLAAAPLQPSEEEQLAQAMRMSVAAAASAEAASPSSAAAADSGLQSALRASMGESAQLPRSVQACMEFGFTLEAAVQAYELCNTPQAQQAGLSADAAHDLLVQRMMDYLCTS